YVRANDPWLLLRAEAPQLRADGIRFFVSTGPPHSRWEKPSETMAFGRALRRDGLPTTVMRFRQLRRHWQHESEAGLRWACGGGRLKLRSMGRAVGQRGSVFLRLGGAWGAGMQLPGGQFRGETPLPGTALSPSPAFPAEIRAPAGSLPG